VAAARRAGMATVRFRDARSLRRELAELGILHG
jgi:hypothetical protein